MVSTDSVGALVGYVIAKIGLLILAAFMFVWNITDIQNVGVNFWNVIWLILAGRFAFWQTRRVE